MSTGRYDPSAAAESTAAPQEDSSALQSIKDRIARNQAKREQAKNVHFDQETPDAPAEPVAAVEPPKGILKDTQPQPPKQKTKAKQKYLKKKLDRKKAAKKQGILGGEGQKESKVTEEDGEKAEETPEQRAERKKQLKEARRLKRAQDAAAETISVQDATPTAESQAATSDVADVDMSIALPDASEPPKKKRKKEKKSEAPVAVEEPIQVSAKDEKALQKAAKAAAKSRRLAANAQPKPIPDEVAQPDHPDALPRFPRPAKLAAPDKSLLAQLSVAEELQGGLRVSPSIIVKVRGLFD